MYENNIPVIILSAGIGNTIEQFLKANNCYYNNIFIISNFIEFDEKGNMKKFEGNLIHTLNKTMKGHLPKEFDCKLQQKGYKLLLGDTIEDKKMVEQNEWRHTITIGFLNEKIQENLEVYKENFDIVLTEEDATFDVVEELVFVERKVSLGK